MSDDSATALFPLPLAPFEEYMFLDDRADYPMVFALQLKLSGIIDRPAFESSFQEALARHPLLCALVCHSQRWRWVWDLSEQLRPVIDWNRFEVPTGHSRGGRIDLRVETGLRCWVREGKGSADVTLQFHHAACDGLGAFQFLADLLAAYGIKTATDDRRPALPGCDPAGLLLREEQAAASISAPEDLDASLWNGVRDAYRMLHRRPAILRPGSANVSNNAESIPFLGMFCHELDLAKTLRLRQTADRHGVTVNDLLVGEMFVCLKAWLAEQSPAPSERWIRIAIPVSLRAGDGGCRSAVNQVSYNLLTRDRRRCDESIDFLKDISRENRPALRHKRSQMLLRSIRCVINIPGASSLFLSDKRCFATTVLSNLGDVNRIIGSPFSCPTGKIVAGNLVLESIVCAPPVRPNTRAAFLVHRYDGRLSVCLRCDPRIFGADDARQLLSLYVERLKWIGRGEIEGEGEEEVREGIAGSG